MRRGAARPNPVRLGARSARDSGGPEGEAREHRVMDAPGRYNFGPFT
jgi:hypothetical protein